MGLVMRINIDVPDGKSGDWSVESFFVQGDELSERLLALKYGRSVPAGNYKRLRCHGEVVMSNTPDEIDDFRYFLHKATGHVLINGLGLGVLLKALINKKEVLSITVIEKSSDVIKLVSESYKHKKVEIINCDAFDFIPPKGTRYQAVWHDIWNYICADNLEEMKKLHRKYGRRCDYQESWCRYQCERAAGYA